MLKKRITKRIKIFDKAKDGKQTPYITHCIDVVMHSLGVCCRVCLDRWYLIKFEVVLNDEQINQLVEYCYMFVNNFVINSKKNLHEWFIEIDKKCENNSKKKITKNVDEYEYWNYYEHDLEFQIFESLDNQFDILTWKIDKKHSGDKRNNNNDMPPPKKQKTA